VFQSYLDFGAELDDAVRRDAQELFLFQKSGSERVGRLFGHARNSSTDNSYRRQTSSRLITPVRTALTITALRRVTQRFVSGDGRSIALDGISPSSKLYNLILSSKDTL
jgi:hypothetical protein